VVGNIMVRHEADISPVAEGGKISGYLARIPGGQQHFSAREEAVAFARAALVEKALAEARTAGAAGATVEVELTEGVQGFAHLSACAIGKPGSDAAAEQ
jgi:hypothetical protein